MHSRKPVLHLLADGPSRQRQPCRTKRRSWRNTASRKKCSSQTSRSGRDTLLRDLQEGGYKEAVEEQKKAVSDIVAAAKRLADMTGQKERLTALLARIEAIKTELEELTTTIADYEAAGGGDCPGAGAD